MLDLNLTVASNSEDSGSGSLEMVAAKEEDHKREKGLLELSNRQMESSGSLNSSSVVNGDEDSCSNGDGLAYSFGVLSGEGGGPVCGANNGDQTIRLFPLDSGANEGKSSGSRNHHRSAFQYEEVNRGDAAGEQRIVALAHRKPQVKKIRRGPRSSSSQYRGVTLYRKTGRWESHIWECGQQVYLGRFDTAQAAARAYDLAAIKFRGFDADINFNVNDYDEDIEQMSNCTKEEFVHILRRQSTGSSRGISKYRGVTLHTCRRWEARMGQFLGNEAYDKAAIKCNGSEVVTNFEPSAYKGEIIPWANNGGRMQSLDLQLGIAPPDISDDPKVSGSMEGFHHQSLWVDMPMDGASGIINFASGKMKDQPSQCPAMASEHPPKWSGVNSSFFPIYKERATEKRMKVDSYPGWAWKIQGPFGGANHLPLFSTAASSGFSSSTIIAPSAVAGQLIAPTVAAQLHFHNRTSSSPPFVPFNHQP